MGGAWESLVKVTKRAMKSITRGRLFTEEALSTVLCEEVEAIVNSRPLTPTSDDPSDYEALTPHHFLSKEFSVPYNSFYNFDIETRRKWKSVVAASNIFWDRFRKEYLTSLNVRRKWAKTVQNVHEGDLVILQTGNVPRMHWPMARVTKTFPGSDNVIRAVEIRQWFYNGSTISKNLYFRIVRTTSSLGGEDGILILFFVIIFHVHFAFSFCFLSFFCCGSVLCFHIFASVCASEVMSQTCVNLAIEQESLKLIDIGDKF